MTSWSVTSLFVQIRTSHITVGKQRWDDHLNTSCSVIIIHFHPFLWKHHVYSPPSGHLKQVSNKPGRTGGHYWCRFMTGYLLHSCSSFHSPGRMYSHRCPARRCRSRAAAAAAPWRARTEEEELWGRKRGCSFRDPWTQHEQTQRMGPNSALWNFTLQTDTGAAHFRIYGWGFPIVSSSVPAQNFSSKCASKASLFVFTSLNGVSRRDGWMDDVVEGGRKTQRERVSSAAPPLDAPLRRSDQPGPRPPRARAMSRAPPQPPTNINVNVCGPSVMTQQVNINVKQMISGGNSDSGFQFPLLVLVLVILVVHHYLCTFNWCWLKPLVS